MKIRCSTLGLMAALVAGGASALPITTGDVTATLEIRLGPFHYMVAALLLLTALVHLALAARAARSPATPQEPA